MAKANPATKPASKAPAKKAPVAKVVKKDRNTLMSQARKLFDSQLKRWADAKFESEKRPYGTFRSTLIEQFETELEVSTPSAATMFNNLRKSALTANPDLVLQRDPKFVKIKSERKPGRPAGTAKTDEPVQSAKETA